MEYLSRLASSFMHHPDVLPIIFPNRCLSILHVSQPQGVKPFTSIKHEKQSLCRKLAHQLCWSLVTTFTMMPYASLTARCRTPHSTVCQSMYLQRACHMPRCHGI